MKKTIITGAFSVVALLTTMGAEAINWTNSGEDLSSLNAQITCDGSNNCALSPITGDTITLSSDSVTVYNPTGVSNFTFDSGDAANPYIITGSTDMGGISSLYFLDVTLNNVTVDGTISNTVGGGVVFANTSIVNNAISINGSITAEGHGISMPNLTGGSLSVNADITQTGTNGYGVDLNSVSLSGDVIIDGSITSQRSGIHSWNTSFNTMTINADITSNGTISGDSGVYVSGGTSEGVYINGDITSDRDGIRFNSSTDNHRVLSINSNVVSNNEHGIRLYGTTVADGITIDGSVGAEKDAIYVENVSTSSLNINADLTSASEYGAYLRSNTISGDVTFAGSMDVSGNGIYSNNGSMNNFTSTSNIIAGSSGIYLGSTTIAGDINIGGTISANSFDGVRLNAVRAGNAIALSGDISTNQGSGLYLHYAESTTTTNSGSLSSTNGAGVYVNAAYSGGSYVNDATQTIVNTGSISSTNAEAIVFAAGGDDTLNYSGTGSLSGGTYDIDMGNGTDTVNISNATLSDLNINSAENLTISDTTISKVLTAGNKGDSFVETVGTTNLSLANVIFDLETDLSTIAGDDLLLMESTGMTLDLANLDVTLNGGVLNGGTLSLVNAGGVDQLRYLVPNMPVAPAFDGAALAVKSLVATTSNVTGQRMNELSIAAATKKRYQVANLQSDVSLFREQATSGVWLQGFGSASSYDGETDKGLDAYDTTFNGVTLGYDTEVGKDVRLGLAVNYATGEVEGDNNSFNVDVENYQATLYGSVNLDVGYLQGSIGYGITNFDQVQGTDKADYDSQNIGGSLKFGKIFTSQYSLAFDPYIGVRYFVINVDEYTSGTQTVEAQNQELLQGQLGVTTYYQTRIGSDLYLAPYVRLEAGYDFSDTTETKVSDSFTTLNNNISSAELGKTIARGAAGLMLVGQDSYNLGFEYEYESRERYESHTGQIKGRMKF